MRIGTVDFDVAQGEPFYGALDTGGQVDRDLVHARREVEVAIPLNLVLVSLVELDSSQLHLGDIVLIAQVKNCQLFRGNSLRAGRTDRPAADQRNQEQHRRSPRAGTRTWAPRCSACSGRSEVESTPRSWPMLMARAIGESRDWFGEQQSASAEYLRGPKRSELPCTDALARGRRRYDHIGVDGGLERVRVFPLICRDPGRCGGSVRAC